MLHLYYGNKLQGENNITLLLKKINLTLSCQHMHHITGGLAGKKEGANGCVQVPEEPNSNPSTSKPQQPLQPTDLPHTGLHLAMRSCQLHPLRSITPRPRSTQHIPVPKTFGGSSSWSPLSPHQLLYSYMSIYNRSFTHTKGAMVLWCTST